MDVNLKEIKKIGRHTSLAWLKPLMNDSAKRGGWPTKEILLWSFAALTSQSVNVLNQKS